MTLEVVLVFVAVVRPNASLSTRISHVDPLARERDYLSALRFYMSEANPIRKIVVVENSGWPIEQWRDELGAATPEKQVEFISLDGTGLPQQHTTGFGEQHIVSSAVSKSVFCGNASHIAKITGRLRLMNIGRLMACVDDRTRLFCDLQSYWMPFALNNMRDSLFAVRWEPKHRYQCDTRFFVAERGFYDQHLRYLHLTAENPAKYWIETAWYRKIRPLHGQPGIRTRFPAQPRFSGYNGTMGFSYDSRKETIKNTVRDVARHVTPWWWL